MDTKYAIERITKLDQQAEKAWRDLRKAIHSYDVAAAFEAATTLHAINKAQAELAAVIGVGVWKELSKQ